MRGIFLTSIFFCAIFNLYAYEYTSQSDGEQDWEDASIWTKSPDETWVADAPGENNIQWHTVNVYGLVNRNGDLTLESSGVLNVYDTLVIYGDVDAAGGATINIGENGLLIVMGNMEMSGGLYFDNTSTFGRVVIVGEYIMGGGANAVTNEFFYLYDSSPTFSGGATVNGDNPTQSPENNFKSSTDLENEDPALFEFINTGSFGTLPVTLAYFKGMSSEYEVALSWETTSEDNFDYFEVQRAVGDGAFYTIALVEGTGDLQNGATYSYQDASVADGVYYYRLKAVDLDGSYEIHPTISVSFDGVETVFSFYPNPVVNDKLTFKLPINSGDVNVEILDKQGKKVLQATVNQWDATVVLPDDQSAGIYFVRANVSGKLIQKKMLIK